MDIELDTLGQGNLLPVHADGLPQRRGIFCVEGYGEAKQTFFFGGGWKFTIPEFLLFCLAMKFTASILGGWCHLTWEFFWGINHC